MARSAQIHDGEEPLILAQADAWLVLAKPAGWHSVSRRGSQGPDIEAWLRSRFDWARDLPEAGLVHRLDQATSGCLMAATSTAAQERWRAAFQSGKGVEKLYLALVVPGLSDAGGFRLFFTSRHKGSKKITAREQGEWRHEGRCAWRMVKRGRDHDLVEVRILGPGRRHQIRAGLAALGHPIVGDDLYGGPQSAIGLALHSWKLRLDGRDVDCPPPTWAAM